MEILALVFSSSQALPFKYLSFAQAELCKAKSCLSMIPKAPHLEPPHCNTAEVRLIGKIHQLLPQRAMIFIALFILFKCSRVQLLKMKFCHQRASTVQDPLVPQTISGLGRRANQVSPRSTRKTFHEISDPSSLHDSESLCLYFMRKSASNSQSGLWPCPPTLQFVQYLYLAWSF